MKRACYGIIVGGCLLLQSRAALAQYRGLVLGKLGSVDWNTAQVQSWTAVQIKQVLNDGEQVRTNANAETAILLQRDKELRMDQGGQIRFLDRKVALDRGKAWIRNRDPDSRLEIIAPGSTVTTLGTEVVVEAQPGSVTVVTVLHGAVNLANTVGAITVPAGYEGRAVPGAAPTLRQVLNPEDAVQWILYYPTTFSRYDLLQVTPQGTLRGAVDSLGRATAYLEQGDYERADSLLAFSASGDVEVQRLTQLAILRLRTLRVPSADSALRQALTIDPNALFPLVLRAKIELTRNHKDIAQGLADSLVRAHPQSVEAHIVAGEVAQSLFKLDDARKHFDRAIELGPDDVHALVDRARVRFGSGDTPGAASDASRAAYLSPQSAEVNSLDGFIRLARDDIRGARAAFDSALAHDPNFAEPHLGLGMLAFKLGSAEDGVREMLAATLLEPRVALYQSYLGKAYHQLKRHRQALAALEVAKLTDARDPTPWLYSALIYRDLNQQGRGLRELRTAIALNDNRAVYRSRLLLDRDVATKNVSLARLYQQLGFDAWAAHEATNSQAADPTNASAHLFLAEAFGNLPDRLQAMSSELLQYRLTAPVNQNSFNTFNEYTALFELPRTSYTSSAEGGLRGRQLGEQAVNGGNGRVAYFGYLGMQAEDGARRAVSDKRWQATLDLALAATLNTNIIGSITVADKKTGSDEYSSEIVGLSTGQPFLIQRVSLDRDTTESYGVRDAEALLGLRHNFSPSTMIQSAVQANWVTADDFMPNYAIDLSADPSVVHMYRGTFDRRTPYAFYDAGLQAVHRAGNQTYFIGAGGYHTDKRDVRAFDLRSDAGLRQAGVFGDTVSDEGAVVWIRHEADIAKRLHTIAGAQLKSDRGHNIFNDTVLTYNRIDPFAGMSYRLTRRTVVRAAAFRSLNSSFMSASLVPATVAGFAIARNEVPYATRREADVSIEHSGDRYFQMLQLSRRRTENPASGPLMPWSNALRMDYHFNYLLASRLGFAVSNVFVRDETARYTSNDNVAQGSLSFVHELGLQMKVTDSYLTQTFLHTDTPELKSAGYNLTDLTFAYELPGKRAKATFAVTNMFNREFSTILEGLTMQRLRPQRHGTFTFQLRY